MNKLDGKHLGVAITGSFCTFDLALECIQEFIDSGATVTAILSNAAGGMDTKFGKASELKAKLRQITNRDIIETIPNTEPIGPGKMLDALVILPCTGNTLAKIAVGIADTPASFAAKSHLRNGRPVIIGVSSNDALAAGAKNIGHLLNVKHVYFVPFGQDNCKEKPRSMVFRREYVLDAVCEGLKERQIQPILV